MSPGIYDHALYCDIAFNFRDIRREVDGIEACIKVHSRVPVRRVLDVGCGTSPHLAELSGRGYAYAGLDSSPAMLEFGRRRAAALGVEAGFIEADLARFTVPAPFDFAFCAMNSLYLGGPGEIANHLKCMAAAVQPGGLYLLDWCVQHVELEPGIRAWEVVRDGVRVRARVEWANVDPVARLFDETVVLEAESQGRSETVRGTSRRYALYPEEFRRLVEASGAFAIAGWWDDWNLDRPLDRIESGTRPLVAMKRVGA
jgi:SAM-dependent methyltransferase